MEWLTKINTQLEGAPAGVLTILACIFLGYALKALKSMPNDRIPIILLLAGIVIFGLFSPDPQPGVSWRNWSGRTIAMGMILAGIAWTLHRFALKKIEARFGGGSGFDSSPNAFPNINPPAQPEKKE